jgi:hypothetical protein
MDIFALDMMIGESKGLSAGRMETLGQGIGQKGYGFDVSNDDGRHHFRRISRRYPALYFVLVYCDQNIGEYGSYLIRGGRSRRYLAPEELIESTMLKHGCDFDDENADEDDNELAYMEASWDLMDQSEARWLNLVYRRLGVGSHR